MAELDINEIFEKGHRFFAEPQLNLTALIKGNHVFFNRYRAGVFYYRLRVPSPKVSNVKETDDYYEFGVPIEDIGEATLFVDDKAITFMRWIRKALKDKTLIKIFDHADK
jgi:hypothetical protein